MSKQPKKRVKSFCEKYPKLCTPQPSGPVFAPPMNPGPVFPPIKPVGPTDEIADPSAALEALLNKLQQAKRPPTNKQWLELATALQAEGFGEEALFASNSALAQTKTTDYATQLAIWQLQSDVFSSLDAVSNAGLAQEAITQLNHLAAIHRNALVEMSQ